MRIGRLGSGGRKPSGPLRSCSGNLGVLVMFVYLWSGSCLSEVVLMTIRTGPMLRSIEGDHGTLGEFWPRALRSWPSRTFLSGPVSSLPSAVRSSQ